MEPVALCSARVARNSARVWSTGVAVLTWHGNLSEPVLWADAGAEGAGRRRMEDLRRSILDPRPCELEVDQYEVALCVQDDIVHLE